MNTIIKSSLYKKLLPGLLLGIGMIGAAHATLMDYNVTGTNGSGSNVDAAAEFDIGTTSMTVTLTNNLVNQDNVSQNISGLFFSLSGVSSISLASQSYATEVDVASDGTYVLTSAGGPFDPGWGFSTSPTGIDALGNGAVNTPALTILGEPDGSTYSNANSSITGNQAHNPFIYESATFTFDFTAIDGKSLDLSNVQFNFGTASDLMTASCTSETCGGCTGASCGRTPPQNVPEPATLALFGVGLLGAGFMRRRVAN